MSYIENGSFKFGPTDMYEAFGLMIVGTGMPSDSFLPAIRSRKTKVPLRHGEYDYGAKYYDERHLKFDVVAEDIPDRSKLREYARDLAYTLSKKSEIRIWNEPDKYYVGRLYNEISLNQIRNTTINFSLDFLCEPFAYGETLTEFFTNRQYAPNYRGTAPTPTYIVITNTSQSVSVNNIRIIQTNKRENY